MAGSGTAGTGRGLAGTQACLILRTPSAGTKPAVRRTPHNGQLITNPLTTPASYLTQADFTVLTTTCPTCQEGHDDPRYHVAHLTPAAVSPDDPDSRS